MSNRAFFLDRDGVINFDHGYVSDSEQFDFVPGVFEACKRIIDEGYLIVVVTNQAGIGRGYYTEADFLRLTDWMKQEFASQQIPVTDVRFCPHHGVHGQGDYLKDCDYRKPNPGMLLAAAEAHNIDCTRSVMVGDKTSDMEAGQRAGITALYKVAEENTDTVQQPQWVSCHRLIDAVNHYFSVNKD